MERKDDMFPRAPTPSQGDPDLRDDAAAPASERWWFGTIVALDIIAIEAFIASVVIPRLT